MRGWKLLYTMKAEIDCNPKPNERLMKQFQMWDGIARREFKKRYDTLKERQKLKLHELYGWDGMKRPEGKAA
jgi:hypothetical protein